ncbi:UNVERIFIED_CONTAM: hypothetical protein Scaly_1792100 [Sesamum calycinum]|uniref:DUF4283 domain-containing protein n=1 Tax=Sesamum calycinum TaxID=2727403 RepID=A0AAW2NX28_9LAMI
MAKGKKPRTPATTTGSTGQQTIAPTTVTVVADTKDSTKATSSEFQAFISDLEASPPFNSLNHASAGHGSNTLGRQEEELLVGKGEKTGATVSAKPSFARLFSTNRKLTMDNKPSKFQIEDGTITLESDDLIDVRASFQQHDSGWLVFRFARDDDRQRILAEVWAILPSLPLECWHPNALGKIGSRLGTPIAMDSLTMRMERVSYARILVEVDASKTLVDQVEFKLPNGVTRRQPVVYEYTPKFCTECNRFEHHKSSCGDTNNQPLPLLLPLLVNLQLLNRLLRRRLCRPNGP